MSLFDPGFIGSLEIPNRFVRSATGEFAANTDGTITKLFLPLFSNLAKGEVGLIIGGDLYVLDEGKASHEMAGISQDYHLSGHKELTKIVHDIGTNSKLAAQLSHSGAHSISAKAPSIRDDMQVVPMDHDDIENVIIGFRDSAIRAKKAGYDAIQLHAAHGYLLSQFLSKRTNQRTDAWGGSLEKRSQLLFTIYSEVRSVVGSNFPIILKINGSDDPIEGFSVAESSEVLTKLTDDGLNAAEISGMNPARAIKKSNEAYFSSTARKIHTRIESLPIILVGGLRTFKMMEKLHREFVDFISMCRPFIREPDLIKKFKEGKKSVDCISCNRCSKSPNVVSCMIKNVKS